MKIRLFKSGIRIYRKVDGEIFVKDYYFNLLKQYRKKIEAEITQRHLRILKDKGIE